MSEIVVFGDVEALAVATLNTDDRVPGAWSTKVPNPRPDEFGRVKRFGGPRETLVSENANLLVEAWALTEARALEILNLARAVLASQDGPLFGYGELGGPNNLPDPTVPEMVRYTLNISVRARGSVLA